MRYIAGEILFPTQILPKMMYSEVNKDDWEMRKIELFADGKIGYAFEDIEVGNTGLADKTIPPTEEIRIQDRIEAYEITKDEFERLWKNYVLGYISQLE